MNLRINNLPKKMRKAGPQQLVVFTAPVAKVDKYEKRRICQLKDAISDSQNQTVTNTNKSLGNALLLAFVGKQQPKSSEKFGWEIPYTDLEGSEGNSVQPVGAFTGINGIESRSSKARTRFNYKTIDGLLRNLINELPQEKLRIFKELFETCFDSERKKMIIKHQKTYELYKLEKENSTEFEAQIQQESENVFKKYRGIIYQHLYRSQEARIKESAKSKNRISAFEIENVDWNEISESCLKRTDNIIRQVKAGENAILLEDPSELWMAVAKNLYKEELISSSNRLVVTDDNLSNIAQTTLKNYETIAELSERPNVFGLSESSSQKNNLSSSDVELIKQIAETPEEEREKIILSPAEIILVAKAYNDVQKQDAIIKGGKPLNYYLDKFVDSTTEAEKCDQEILTLESSADEPNAKRLEELRKQSLELKQKATYYKNVYESRTPAGSGWKPDGTREVPGIEGVEFARAKRKSDPTVQIVEKPEELKARILRREIQTLGFKVTEKYKNIDEQSKASQDKPVSFLENAHEYLSQKEFTRKEIVAFLDVYKRSLRYYGKGLKVTDTAGKESTVGGYAQISLAAAQIANFSQGSAQAQELYKCMQTVMQKDITNENVHVELANMTMKQLEELRTEFTDRVGVDLLALEPEAAAFGINGTNLRPTQPHDVLSRVNIVNVEVTKADGTKQIKHGNRLTIIARDGYFRTVSENPITHRQSRGSLGSEGGSAPLNHYFSRVVFPAYHNHTEANPILTPAMKRERAAEEAVNKAISDLAGLVPEEAVLKILIKGLIKPLYLSYGEKEILNSYIVRAIVEKLGAINFMTLRQDQLKIENGHILGLQNIDKSDLANLNTKTLFDVAVKKLGDGIKFDTSLSLTPRGDFEMVISRCILLREALENHASKNTTFYLENDDQINYYAGYKHNLESLEGRLKIMLDLQRQTTNSLKAHNIDDYNARLGALKQTLGLKKYYVEVMKAINAEGSKVVQDWFKQYLVDKTNVSTEQILLSLPNEVRECIMDNHKFQEFILGKEKFLEALSADLEREEKFNEILSTFGVEVCKKFFKVIINPFEKTVDTNQQFVKQDFWTIWPLAHWFLNGEKIQQVSIQADNIFVIPHNLVRIENGQLLINLHDPQGTAYECNPESERFIDVFILQAHKFFADNNFEFPVQAKNDNAVAQLKLLKQGYADAKKLKGHNSTKRRFEAILELEMLHRFIEKRYPIPAAERLTQNRYDYFNQAARETGNYIQLETIYQGIKGASELYLGANISMIQNEELRDFMQHYCSNEKLFIKLMNYFELITQIHLEEAEAYQKGQAKKKKTLF